MNGFHGRIRMPKGRYITIEQILCHSQVFIGLLAAYINDFPFCLVNRLSFIINQFHFGNTGLIIFCIGRKGFQAEVAKSGRYRKVEQLPVIGFL